MNSRASPSPRRKPILGLSLGGLTRFWQSALVVWGSVTAIGVVIAFALPALYESASLVEVRATSNSAPPGPIERTIRSLTADKTLLTGLARYTDAGDESLDQALETTRGAISVTEVAGDRVRIAFRARRPESAQRGARDVMEAVLRGLSSSGANSDARSKQAELEQRTQELAVFVASHPDVMGESPPSRPDPSARTKDDRALDPGLSDPTILVLRQEKKRFEAELAARSAPPGPSSVFGPNPYDEPQQGLDTATIQRRLNELRVAILAHQRAVAEKQNATSSKPRTPGPGVDPALIAQWRKLVQGVVDAQKNTPASTTAGFETRIVEDPSLPSRPMKPNRLLVGVVGMLAGMWSSLVYVLFRTRKYQARRRAQPRAATPSVPVAGDATAARSDANRPANAAIQGERSDPPAPIPQPVGAPIVPSVAVQPPGEHAHAQQGVIDVAASDPTRAAAANAALRPRPTVDVSPGRRGSVPTAFANTIAAGDGIASPAAPAPAAAPTSPGLPRSDPPLAPPRPSSDPPERRSSNPPRRTSSGPPRPSSSIPPRPSSNPPPRAAHGERISSGPAAAGRDTLRPPPKMESDRPPAVAATAPPVRETTRPSVTPGPPRRTISPPPMAMEHAARGSSDSGTDRSDDAPNTRRMGSPEQGPSGATPAPHTSARPSERVDTTYSIVDRSRRPASRKPEPPPDYRMSDRGTRPLTTDPTGVLRPASDPPQVRQAIPRSDRPRPKLQGGTRPGWAIPGPSPQPREEPRPSSNPPPGRDDEVVRPLSVPPSWRPPPPKPMPEAEITQLRDQILAQRKGQCFVIGITSAADALAAKSVLASSLAVLLAQGSARVLVMEANFDFPAVHRVLGIDMPRLTGFSQQVHARIRSGERAPWKVVRCNANLDVLAEGFMRSPGVAFSREFSEAISELRRGYDFIVADGPTASAGADCKPLNAFADGLVVAVRPGAKLADALERAARWFTRKDLMAAVFVDIK